MIEKIRKKVAREDVLIFALLTLVNVVIFWDLLQVFFQQDLWLGVGGILANGSGYILRDTTSLLRAILGEGRILAKLTTYLLLVKNPLNITTVTFFAILIHSVNSILVYILAKRIINKRIPSFIGALFFAINSVSHGALTFPAAVVVTLPATLLILIALLKYFDYLETPITKTSFFSIFLVSLLSLYFKEVGFFLFLFFPLSYLIYKRPPLKLFVRKFWIFIIFFVLIGALRVGDFRVISTPVALYLTGANQNFFSTLIVRAIFYPLTSFSLMYVPATYFISFARWITSIYYPFVSTEQFVLISETIVLDMLSMLFSILIIVALGLLARRVLKIERKHIVFLVTFTLASFMPYIIVGKSYSYLDSRFYYLSVVGASLILAWLLGALWEIIKKDYLKIFVVLPIALLFLSSHVLILKRDLAKEVKISKERLSFLANIKTIKPTLEENRNVFYITSDTDYYLPGNKVPFQSGMGYTLMVWYFDSGKIPKSLLEEGYLFELGSQGYKEAEGFGFGYFSDKRLMEEVLSNTHSKKEVTYLYYDPTSKKLMRN